MIEIYRARRGAPSRRTLRELTQLTHTVYLNRDRHAMELCFIRDFTPRQTVTHAPAQARRRLGAGSPHPRLDLRAHGTCVTCVSHGLRRPLSIRWRASGSVRA